MILSILKVIGIILLIILAVIIFIVLVVLFTPVRYRFSGSVHDALEGEAVIRWRPVLLKAEAAYHHKELIYTVSLLGGVVMTNTPAKLSWLGRKLFGEAEKAPAKSPKKAGRKPPPKNKQAAGKTAGNKETPQESSQYTAGWQEEEEDFFSDRSQETFSENHIKTKQQAQDEKKESFFQRFQKKRKKFQRKWREFVRTVRKLNHKKEALLTLYHSKRFEQAKLDLKQYIGTVIQIIKPEHLEGYIRFGLDNPANTGYIFGIAAMFIPLYQGFLTVEPDFTEQIHKGFLRGNGKIHLISVVKLAIKVILNKNLIKVTKKVQTILEA